MILDLFRLGGKVALVTGAAQGLGRGIAVGLAEAGAQIVALDRQFPNACIAEIEANGGQALSHICDLSATKSQDAEEIVRACREKFGRLDILVNNAGTIRRAPALEFSEDDWESVLALNLSAVFYLSQAFARQCVAHQTHGKIINLASMLSYQGGITVPSYAAAKSGIAGLTRALANEWAALGINVNALAPGYFATDVTAGIRSDPARNASVLSRLPAGRWGEPQDLQGAVVFLASPASDYMHGTLLPVDGGWLAR
jgi:2-deoxy-D-gluconate 3-dehydrogenase